MRILMQRIGIAALRFIGQRHFRLEHRRRQGAELTGIRSADNGRFILVTRNHDLGLGAQKQEREHVAVAQCGSQQLFGVVARAISEKLGIGR